MTETTPALQALEQTDLRYAVTRHGPVFSLAEAAMARGLDPDQLIKTMVVRRGSGDYLFVLVPGSRSISWPKLRALLGVNRLSMPDAARAKDVTGYERGTITPFGATTAWPVIADSRIAGQQVSIGGGGHGIGVTLAGDDLVTHLDATVADVTESG
ncbi:aminoacyl-tRNA deacylase [Ruania halotolerans]|uniref:aminoacyl-tRNA deacylase n=1 Tax=Ruania halotolerans TaxID=2897773 RepID=UPI001E447CFC|nr:YbaK/EbsC family protein [Ruania halotolerans]UFU07433.1 YbaK/EbsC family protein [Ruania halotolerans]